MPLVGAPEVLTYHCVEAIGLRAARGVRVALAPAPGAGRAPPRRCGASMPLGVFWKPRHALVRARARRARRGARARRALLALPWARAALPSYGAGPRGRARAVGRAARARRSIDAVEVAALAAGSVRHRTLFL